MDVPTPATGTATVVRVHYPFPAGPLVLRHAATPRAWDQDHPLERTAPDTWTAVFRGLQAPLEFKPLLAGQHWAKGPNWVVAPGARVDVWPRFFRDDGAWRRAWPEFRSQVLGNTRGVWLYEPPTALENPTFRAPVIYMHDGQNLFDAQAAYGNTPWRVGETMNQAAQDGSIAEAFVVGVENRGEERLAEYSPWVDPVEGGGHAALYVRMLVEELKPFIDTRLATRPEREATALVGSSLGGLVSAWAGLRRPDVFGLIGAMSPSSSWARRALVEEAARARQAPHRPVRLYADAGDIDDELPDTEVVVAALRRAGFTDGEDFSFVVQPGAWHNEQFWAQRLPGALRFLLGPAR